MLEIKITKNLKTGDIEDPPGRKNKGNSGLTKNPFKSKPFTQTVPNLLKATHRIPY